MRSSGVKKIWTILLVCLGSIFAIGGITRLLDSGDRNNKDDSTDIESSVSTSDGRENPYDGMSDNVTVLRYNLTEDNLTISFKNVTNVQRIIYTDTVASYPEGWTDPTEGQTEFEYTFDTPGLKQVEIFGARDVSERAFYEETRLTYIAIGEGVESVGKYAFCGCNNLNNVTFSNTVQSIGYGAFLKSGIVEINIPDSVTDISGQAFMYCYSAKTISIGDGVKEIPASAFAYATGVTSLTIGSNVETIGDNAFSGYKGLTNLVIPDSVKTIGASSFSNSDKITTLTIGSGVTSIGANAFSSFLKVETVYCCGLLPPTVGEKVFYGWNSIKNIYVRNETAKYAYQSENGWSAFSDKISVNS